MQRVALLGYIRQVLTVHIIQYFVLHVFGFLSLPLDVEIRQVLSSVDPETNGPLYLEHDRYQNLLDHLRVLHSLWVPQDLLDSWINFGSLGSYQLALPSEPRLNYPDRTVVL